MEDKEIKCSVCGCDYAEHYYKDEYSDIILCEDCLLEIDGMTSSTTTNYFLDGEYMGSDDDFEELIESILGYTTFEKIEEEQ